MKNIFLVINKEKIYAYIVSVLTICTLFFVSGIIHKDVENSEPASSNISENSIENNTENMILNNKEIENLNTEIY